MSSENAFMLTAGQVRPHTNITEIEEGLDLLWRNSVDPSKVVMGLGWYGRTFTLENPSCKSPWCRFQSGGEKGACSGEVGILTNAGKLTTEAQSRRYVLINQEIKRVIKTRGLKPSFDATAAVKWISWDNQWASYDDGETMQLKLQYANKRVS
jgi:chitinase